MAKDRAERADVPGLEGTPYRLVREIGRGGMGSVHEVEHRALGKVFVMKVLHESLAHREDFALRMKREWRTLARLEHPAIVQVTDAGRTTEGLPFFVMERLDGQTISDLLQLRGRLSAREAVETILVVLSGLEAAHRAGAIHRDIKPQNLFLTPRGPKILDFGIVKSKRKGAPLVTRSGVAIGTPRYMAPEQAAGLPVDGRADVYACGLVLFEMIAGRDPFHHLKEVAALVGAHISELPPRLDDVCAQVPPALADVLSRFLAKDPADRPASARLAQIELEALLPLLEDTAGSARELSTVGSWSSRQEESTAGATSLTPSASSVELSGALGIVDTATLDPSTGSVEEALPKTPLSEEPEVRATDSEAALAKSPSLTPPPVAARATPQRAGANRWALGAGVVLGVAALGLVAVVFRPEITRGLSRSPSEVALGAPSYDFPETPSAAPVAATPVAARPSPEPQALDRRVLLSNDTGNRAPHAAPLASPRRAEPAEALPQPVKALQTAAPSAEGPPPSAAEPPPEDLPGSGLW